MKQAAGILLYRHGSEGLEVLLVHPSGNYNRHKPWSIPKGEPDPGEDDLEMTARRETREEAGIAVQGSVTPLGSIKYTKSGKVVHAFAGRAPEDAKPMCASWEIDQARFVSLEEARRLLHPEQAVFLDRLLEMVKSGAGD
jgi:predicted NUDIX family NTP pyrophosphohydrolase